MTDPIFRSRPLREAADLPVFVDVGRRQKIDPRIQRNGIPIGVHVIDLDVLSPIITEPVMAVKVLSQSVAPGTPVPEGTAVDLVLVHPARVPVGVIRGVHRDIATLTMQEGLQRLVLDNPVGERLAARAAAGLITTADHAAVRTLFADAQMPIVAEAGRDLDAAVETLRTLNTFRDAR